VSLITPFEVSNFFSGCWSNNENWLEPKTNHYNQAELKRFQIRDTLSMFYFQSKAIALKSTCLKTHLTHCQSLNTFLSDKTTIRICTIVAIQMLNSFFRIVIVWAIESCQKYKNKSTNWEGKWMNLQPHRMAKVQTKILIPKIQYL